MSATGNGTSRYQATVGTIVGPTTAYSVGCWFNPANTPTTAGGSHNPFGIGDGIAYSLDFRWDDTNAAFYKSVAHLQAATGFCICQIIGTPAANVWHHILATWNGTTLSLYLDGVLNNTATGTNPPASTAIVTALAYAGGAAAWCAGSLAELTIWNSTLTAAQAFAIGTGTLATTIQNGNILFYSTLNTGDPGQLGPALVNSATVINTTYFQNMSGGLALGGNNTTTAAHYNHRMSGGLAIGGTLTTTKAHYNHRMSGGLALGGSLMATRTQYHGVFSGGLALGGNGTLVGSHYNHRMSGGLALGGKAFQVVQPVASGAVILGTGREPAQTTK